MPEIFTQKCTPTKSKSESRIHQEVVENGDIFYGTLVLDKELFDSLHLIQDWPDGLEVHEFESDSYCESIIGYPMVQFDEESNTYTDVVYDTDMESTLKMFLLKNNIPMTNLSLYTFPWWCTNG